MNSKSCFCAKTALLGTALHCALTFFFVLLIFIRAMGAYTHSVTEEMIFWNFFSWAWSPLARACFTADDPNLVLIKLLALLWSVLVGLVAGWLQPYFREPDSMNWE